jgi:hypothetical protein
MRRTIGGGSIFMGHKQFIPLAAVSAAILLGGCAGGTTDAGAVPETAKVEDYYIVDCLLPGQIRRLGDTTYQTPRRPVRTTAGDCNLRGGEYVAYDRADYKTALKVWLPAAERGDPEAQNAVGEIFERGLGTTPNEELAAIWYRRAAEQGYKAAQVNIATLYETGRGVPKDSLVALNWYRKAWGIEDDELVMRSEAERELIAQAERAAAAEQRAQAAEEKAEATGDELARARALAARARSQQQAANARARAAEAQAAQATAAGEEENIQLPAGEGRAMPRSAPRIEAGGRSFGRYFALIIGNDNYINLRPLATPIADGRRLARVLGDRYGFAVQLVNNGDDVALLRALNQLNEVLEEDDNLLLYYAGHGNRRPSANYEAGYWLPVNAEAPPDDTFWVPTEQVAGHLARLKARRILVIADSAFAGLLAENPAFLLATEPEQLRSDPYIDLRLPNRARLLMTSGVDAPLPRRRAGYTSVFADALIEALRSNTGVLTAPALFLSLLNELAIRQPELDPEFKAIKRAGDEVGDFFFVANPQTNRQENPSQELSQEKSQEKSREQS